MSKYFITPTDLSIRDFLATSEIEMHELEGERCFSYIDVLQISQALKNSVGRGQAPYRTVRRFDMPWAPGEVDKSQIDNDKRSQWGEYVGAKGLFANLNGFTDFDELVDKVHNEPYGNSTWDIFHRFFDITRNPNRLLEGTVEDYDVFADIASPEEVLDQTERDCARLAVRAALKDVYIEANEYLEFVVGSQFPSMMFGKRSESDKASSTALSVVEFAENSGLNTESIRGGSWAIVNIG